MQSNCVILKIVSTLMLLVLSGVCFDICILLPVLFSLKFFYVLFLVYVDVVTKFYEFILYSRELQYLITKFMQHFKVDLKLNKYSVPRSNQPDFIYSIATCVYSLVLDCGNTEYFHHCRSATLLLILFCRNLHLALYFSLDSKFI